MVPSGEHNMARVNQTGGITTNYGGRLIPRLWTSKELLRWKKNQMKTSEGGKNNLHPAFIAGLGHLVQKQLGDSAESSRSPFISPLPLDFVWGSSWIIHHQFRCFELCSGLNFETLTFLFFALRSRACLFASLAMSKQTREMSKEKEQRWNPLLQKERVHLGS